MNFGPHLFESNQAGFHKLESSFCTDLIARRYDWISEETNRPCPIDVRSFNDNVQFFTLYHKTFVARAYLLTDGQHSSIVSDCIRAYRSGRSAVW